MYAEEMPDSLSPSSGSSAVSRSDEGSKTPSEASNYSDDEERPGNVIYQCYQNQ